MTVPVLAVALLISPVSVPMPPSLAAPVIGTQPDDAAVARAVAPLSPLSPLRLVAPFDPPTAAFGAGHRGVDLAGSSGQEVLSALPGTVTTAGWIGGMPVVVVSHGDIRTTYQPVEPTVAVGQVVAAGQSLGALAAHGSHCAPDACLHWGLKRDDEYLDPMALLAPRRVRLLPLVPETRP